MTISNSLLVGPWTLVAAVQTTDELPVEDEAAPTARPPEIATWLRGDGGDLLENASPAAGLMLTVGADGGFEERFDPAATPMPAAEFYDGQGVATIPPEPFEGRLRAIGDDVWMEVSDGHAAPVGTDTLSVRYDDGDTVVSERLAMRGDRLVRTQNVVTDELYLSRSVFIYERAG